MAKRKLSATRVAVKKLSGNSASTNAFGKFKG